MNIVFWACPIYNIFGIPCPCCGMTRAYILLFSGQISEAFKMHPLLVLPPLFLFKPFRKRKYIISAVILFAIVYVIRFILLFPNTPPFVYGGLK